MVLTTEEVQITVTEIEADFIVDTLRGAARFVSNMDGHHDGDHGFRCDLEDPVYPGQLADKIAEQL